MQREGRNEKNLSASADQCMTSNCRGKRLARDELSLWKEVLVGKGWSGRALGAIQVKLTQSHTDTTGWLKSSGIFDNVP